MSCYYAGSESPRLVAGRHLAEGCECKGCQPCPESHCLGCFKEHHPHVCPGCLADVREDLGEIGRLCDSLPEEVETKGVDSEAFNLLGPTADPEALGHMKASVAVGRVPEDWLEEADHELHPLMVAGTWMEAYLEAFDHDEPARITVESALSYLTRNLTEIGAEDDIPFRDFRRDLADCRTHLERVLHDGEQVETGAPCMTCRVPLRLVRDTKEDRWQCPRCKQASTATQYRYAMRQDFIENSPELNVDDMAVRTGLASSTIRKWANVIRVQVKGEDAEELPALIRSVGVVNQRKVYAVADVEAVHEAGGDTRRSKWRARRGATVLAESA